MRYTSLSVLILLLTSSIALAIHGYSGSYSLIVDGYLVELSVSIAPSDILRVDRPIEISYGAKVKSLNVANASSSPLHLAIDLAFVCRDILVDSVRFLGTLDIKQRKALDGTIAMFLPPEILKCIEAGSNYITLIPKVVVVGTGVRVFELTPIQLYIDSTSTERAKYAIASKCTVDTDNLVELCVSAPYTYDLSEEPMYRVDLSVATVEEGNLSGVTSLLVNGSIATSKYIEGISRYFRTKLSVSREALEIACIRDRYAYIELKLSGYVNNKSIDIEIPWITRCYAESHGIDLSIHLLESPVVAGSALKLAIEIKNPNPIPVMIEFIKARVNGSEVKSLALSRLLKPLATISMRLSIPIEDVGYANVSIEVSYRVLDKVEKLVKSIGVEVSRAIYIECLNNIVRIGSDLKLLLTTFKPVKGVKIVAVHGNSSKVIWVVDAIPTPKLLKLSIPIDLEPGNYSVKAISIEGLESNSVNITVVSISSSRSSRAELKTLSTPGFVSIKLVNGSVHPSQPIVLDVMLSKPMQSVEFKVYRQDLQFTPPWVLIPKVDIEKLSDTHYRVSFRAPEKSGSYIFKLEVFSQSKKLAEKSFAVRVVEARASSSESIVSQMLLPKELFIPIVATAALAGVLVLRRKRKR